MEIISSVRPIPQPARRKIQKRVTLWQKEWKFGNADAKSSHYFPEPVPATSRLHNSPSLTSKLMLSSYRFVGVSSKHLPRNTSIETINEFLGILVT
jgi:hypothetical protein